MAKKISWEQATLNSLDVINNSVQRISETARRSGQAKQMVSDQHGRFESNLKSIRQSLSLGRSMAGELASRKLHVELVFSRNYVEHLLNLDSLIQSLRLTTSVFSFVIRKPIEVWTIRDGDTDVCNAFGPDQIGVGAKAFLKLGQSEYKLRIFFALAFALGVEPARAYLVHDARLDDTNGLEPGFVGDIEQLINTKLREKLAGSTLPPLITDPIATSSQTIKYMTSKVGKHVSLLARIVPTASPVPGSNPVFSVIPPLSDINPCDHAVIRISSSFFLKQLEASLDKFLREHPIRDVRFEAARAAVVPQDPSDPHPDPEKRERVFRVSAPASCTDEFDDRHDYGTVDLYARFATRTPAIGRGQELFLRTYVLGLLGAVIDPKDLPEQILLTLPDAQSIDQLIEEKVATIRVRFVGFE